MVMNSGWWLSSPPLWKKKRLRQLGWWNSQVIWKNDKLMFQVPPTRKVDVPIGWWWVPGFLGLKPSKPNFFQSQAVQSTTEKVRTETDQYVSTCSNWIVCLPSFWGLLDLYPPIKVHFWKIHHEPSRICGKSFFVLTGWGPHPIYKFVSLNKPFNKPDVK